MDRWMPPKLCPLLPAVAVLLGACFPTAGPGGGPVATGPAGSARLLINWTINGAAPSETACKGIDHLELLVDDGARGVTISPVPCALTRFRFDNMPEGQVLLRLDALDGAKCVVASGSAAAELSEQLPPSPAPTIKLSQPIPCAR
jgi:hypothetical protein